MKRVREPSTKKQEVVVLHLGNNDDIGTWYRIPRESLDQESLEALRAANWLSSEEKDEEDEDKYARARKVDLRKEWKVRRREDIVDPEKHLVCGIYYMFDVA